MESFSNKMQNFSSSLVESIDKMEWLELSSRPKPINDVDEFMGYISRWPLFVHMISACICLGFSAFFHLFNVYSPGVKAFLARLDYGGIIILIFGSFVSPVYYHMSCGPSMKWRNTYFTFHITISLITFIATLHPIFDKPVMRKFRSFLFIFISVFPGLILLALVLSLDRNFTIEP
jgi:predicted membrane channel-forming protein YqfA (hemolysin III family)